METPIWELRASIDYSRALISRYNPISNLPYAPSFDSSTSEASTLYMEPVDETVYSTPLTSRKPPLFSITQSRL
ncbi:unnamed protein product, partial [Mesorhabditis spiculigera]